jgi:hypothetical protein
LRVTRLYSSPLYTADELDCQVRNRAEAGWSMDDV